MNIMSFIKSKTIGFYISAVAAIIALLANIVFIIIANADKTFSLVTFIFILLAVAAVAANAFKNYKFLPIVSALCYGVALGMHLFLALPTLSDVVNGVNFVGGNPTIAMAYIIIFFVVTAASVAACFMSQEKDK